MTKEVKSTRTATLTLAALGVVYGNIGTSPLYTVKEVFAPATGIALTSSNIIGAVSAIFWALMLVVTLKYVSLICASADNNGEGGLALTALAANAVRSQPLLRGALLILVVWCHFVLWRQCDHPCNFCHGCAKAWEVLTPDPKPYVLPMFILVLVLLFIVQRRGTEAVANFLALSLAYGLWCWASLACYKVLQAPAILAARSLQCHFISLSRVPQRPHGSGCSGCHCVGTDWR
jgi:KUP system potassium uptake protein